MSPATQPQAAPRPVIRAQAPDEPSQGSQQQLPTARPPALRIPSPEELGVSASAVAENTNVDWAGFHRQLDQLGAKYFRWEKTTQGGCRVVCLLGRRQGHSHRIEALAANEAEAIRLTLSKAEEWAGSH